MVYRVHLSDKADRDIEGVLRWFVASGAERAGEKWLAQLDKKIASLMHMPLRCPLAFEAEELGIGLRELLFGKRNCKDRILYLVEGRSVDVAHIRRGSRDRIALSDLW